MSSIMGSLSIAVRAMMADQGALQVVSNNVANINTPGYTRERANLVEEPPVQHGSPIEGNGVTLESVSSLRDRVLELRLDEEEQSKGKLDSYMEVMSQAQVYFNSGSGHDLGGVLNDFFSSLSQLSTDPTSMPFRQQVLMSAQNLAAEVSADAKNLTGLQSQVDQTLTQQVQQAGQLLTQIAALNRQIGFNDSDEQNGALIDQRTQLIRNLSQLMDVRVVNNANGGISLTTGDGTSLIAGDRVASLSVHPDGDGKLRVFVDTTDVTDSLQGGSIRGLLDARDQGIGGLLGQLDEFAAGLSNALNTAHQQGYTLSGAQGGNLMAPQATITGAAARMQVAITDPADIAASSDGSPGSNGNLNTLLALQNAAVVNGRTPSDAVADIVFQAGSDVSNASAELDGEQAVLDQLDQQRSSVSGVSLDEEAANMVRFQRSYEAAARVISIIDDLTLTVINIGTGGAVS